MTLTLAIGFSLLALIVASGLAGIRKEIARSATSHFQMAEALRKLAEQAGTIEIRLKSIQVEQFKLTERVAGIKNEEVRRETEDMIAKGARVLDG